MPLALGLTEDAIVAFLIALDKSAPPNLSVSVSFSFLDSFKVILSVGTEISFPVYWYSNPAATSASIYFFDALYVNLLISTSVETLPSYAESSGAVAVTVTFSPAFLALVEERV